MGLFDWFNPTEPDTTTFEVSNDDGEQIVFTVPTKGASEIRTGLRNAGIPKDTDDTYSRSRTELSVEARDPNELRWWGKRDCDPKEDLEPNGDREPVDDDTEPSFDREQDYSDYEESEQDAEMYWPFW
ncbi:hypothetical protein IQ260_19615 [Leptolyngbya cf. ectocarpi LEGE 11479]|uniref:Uncharacterized protein n=1 Tax=Leptolyngbya cf. ectocarpi LEGE 11479 TaxID=1828722 RepID=A0A929F8K3_LEPEC|nr:hypothetical protein [Leptolyngbya ectocarpi]MBE9068856.1 hypothetical protein [Leptolyngbya cf. ectocarpi LEGE 11479]